MMIEQIILTIVLLGRLFLRFAAQDDERQALVDLANVHSVVLRNERAQRAGAGERLRERVLSESGERTSDLRP